MLQDKRLYERSPAGLSLFFHEREKPQCRKCKNRNHDGDIIATQSDSGADRAGGPYAGCGRSAVNKTAMIQNSAAADEPNSGNDALHDTRGRIRRR